MRNLPLFLPLLVTTALPFLTIGISPKEKDKSPSPIQVEFDVQLNSTSTGKFILEVHPEWSSIGSKRFLELIHESDRFWKDMRFWRTMSSFLTQFGIPGDTSVSSHWKSKKIKDDDYSATAAAAQSNKRGTISFAHTGPDTRTTQMFINLADNGSLDGFGFHPFGVVVEGMDSVVDYIYAGYGESKPQGNGPQRWKIYKEGNEYLERDFPKLSYVKSVRRLDDGHVQTKKERHKNGEL